MRLRTDKEDIQNEETVDKPLRDVCTAGDSRDIAVTLDGTPIADGLEFPADHTVTITTTASTVITGNVFFTGSTGR